MNELPDIDLSDKIVFIYKANSNNDVALQYPRVEQLHGRTFLVGRVPDGGSANDWLAGLVTHVGWDQIEEFVVFDSLEDFYERLSRGWREQNLQ